MIKHFFEKLSSILVIVLCSGLWAGVASADEIEQFIDEAKQSYKKGNYNLSLERLEQAMNLVKDVQAANIVQYFPEPLKSWSIAEAEEDNASPIPNVQLGILSTIIRRYKQYPNEGISINLLSKSEKNKQAAKTPWVQFTLLQKPNALVKMGFQGMHALRANQPDSKTIEVDGYAGILFCDDKSGTCDAFFDFDGKFMLMVNSDKTDKKDVEAYLRAFDVKGLLSAN